MSIQNIVDEIVLRLLKNDIVVQYYKSYSTNSYYLKCDYGILNSIRISDHPGKKQYKYKYNVHSNIAKSYKTVDKFVRFYFAVDEIDRLIFQIVNTKRFKIVDVGENKYKQLMQSRLEDNSGCKGFWSNSVLIEGEKQYEDVKSGRGS